jgi:uncharacterized repeat protein (TIGR01451 family)
MLPGFTTPVDEDYADILSPTLQRIFNITKTVTGSFASGSIMTYTLSLCNSGQANISAYTVADPLPSALTYVPSSSSFE